MSGALALRGFLLQTIIGLLEILEEENKILKRRIYCLEMQQQKTPERPSTDEELKK